MHHDLRYECALAAALVICEELDALPGMPRHQRLARVLFSIIHAMNKWDEERDANLPRFSLN